MYCNNCGVNLPNKTKFCNKCGQTTEEQKKSNLSEIEIKPTVSEKKSTIKVKKPIYLQTWPYIVFTIVLFIIYAALSMEPVDDNQEQLESKLVNSTLSVENQSLNNDDSEDLKNEPKSLDEVQEELDEAWNHAKDSTKELGQNVKDTFWEVWNS